MPTADDITTAAAEIADIGVQSSTTGDTSTTAIDPEKLLRVSAQVRASEAMDGTNPAGGARSPWNLLRPAKGVMPGGG